MKSFKSVTSSVVLALLMLTLFASCFTEKSVRMPNSGSSASVVINSDRYYSNGTLMRARLMTSVNVQGYNCKGWIYFYDNGKLMQFELASMANINGSYIPSSTIVFFTAAQKTEKVWLSANSTIQEINCAGGNKIEVSFYDNGKIKCCFLSQNQTIQGMQCEASVMKPVCFYSSGKLKSFSLAATQTIQSVKFNAGTQIALTEDGRILK